MEPQLTRSVEEPEGASISIATRLRRALEVPFEMLGALFVPDRFMPRLVFVERATAAVLVVVLAAGFSAWVVGTRIDMTRPVYEQEVMMMRDAGPEAEARSDRDIDEQIQRDRVIEQVKLGLGAGLWTPLRIALLAVALYLLGRYVGGKPTVKKTFVVAAYGSLPLAVKSIVIGVQAWSMTGLTPGDIDKLQATARLGGPILGMDLFGLWSAVLIAFGLAAAAAISRRRAFIAVLVCFAFVSLLTGGGPPPRGPMPGKGQPS